MGYLKNRESGWTSRAACKGEPVEIFYKKKYLKIAQRICSACVVKKECGLAGRKEKFGVWGGIPRGWLREEK